MLDADFSPRSARQGQGAVTNPSMSVTHVSYSDGGGGAARGAYTLHTALRKLGMASKFVVAERRTADPTVLAPEGWLSNQLHLGNRKLEELLPRLLGDPKEFFSVNIFGSNTMTRARRTQPDLIHIHWAGYGTLAPRQLRNAGSPVVWTLRDMWPLTGGCHYTRGCERFTSRCGSCPVLGSRKRRDISTWGQQRKQRAFRESEIHLVALSRWMEREARKSQTLEGLPVTVIPPGIDLDVFHPLDPAAARRQLHLPPEDKIILFAAIDPSEARKGWAHLRKALHLISGQRETTDDAFSLMVTASADSSSFTDSPVRTIALGKIENDRKMAAAYSAADVCVVPSLQEAFGKVAIESLASGTPVVAFQGTGIEDAIRHKVTGYLAEYGESEDLASGIHWALEIKGSGSFGSAIEPDRQRYSMLKEARAYLDLYEEVLADGT